MHADANGFLYPRIRKKKCVACGLCTKACPVLNPPEQLPPKKCFAAETQNDGLHLNSSSGGIFGELALSALDHGGYVAGCAWDDTGLKAKHIVVGKREDLPRLYRSKYVQSDIGDVFSEVKKILASGKSVLFSGTPCQVAALHQFLGNGHDGLTTVEIICHGVPSPAVFERYKKECSRKYRSNLSGVNFRAKERVHGNEFISLEFEGKNVVSAWKDDVYFNSFLQNYILRESCFRCSSNDGRSGADITLGDFWGIQDVFPECRGSGYSAVVVRSEKGMRLWNEICQNAIFREVSYDSICKGNPVCRKSVAKPYAYRYYMAAYKMLGLGKTLRSAILLNRIAGRIRQ
jgi:coenzyme F420-reducing hydrogenase beta subunit